MSTKVAIVNTVVKTFRNTRKNYYSLPSMFYPSYQS